MTNQTDLIPHGPRTQEDKQWFASARSLFHSRVDFLLAEFMDDANLSDCAANVLIWRDGRFSTVRELVDQCASHNWNRLIYEAWAWETGHRIRSLIRKVDVTASRALEVYAQRNGYFETDVGEMRDAIEEAREALEGKVSWDDPWSHDEILEDHAEE